MKNFKALKEHPGFSVLADAEVSRSTGKAKVIHKKSTEYWRHWFTEEDVKLLKHAYTPYMELMEYDCSDWDLSPNPVIEPEYSSVYMRNIAHKASKNSILSYLEPIVHRLTKRQ